MLVLATAVDSPAQGGIPVVNRLVLDAAARAGRAVTLVSLHDGPRAPSIRAHPGSAGCGGGRLRFLLAAAGRRCGAGDLVLVTHAGLAPGGRMARGRGRMAVFLHGVEAWRPLPRRTRWGLDAADLFIANSSVTLRRFHEANPRHAGAPAAVCPLPARDLPAAGAAVEREPAVLIVGRLWGRGLRKGQDLLVRLWPEVLRVHPAARLRIVGDGEGRPALEALAREVGVAGSVEFHGGVDDAALARHYATASVFAMPGEGEGFGLVFAEAMAHGLPCVASTLDAGAEVVEHGRTGFVVDPRDGDAVLRALLDLLGDADLRARLGAAARERARTRFSGEGFRARIMDLLDGLGGRS